MVRWTVGKSSISEPLERLGDGFGLILLIQATPGVDRRDDAYQDAN